MSRSMYSIASGIIGDRVDGIMAVVVRDNQGGYAGEHWIEPENHLRDYPQNPFAVDKQLQQVQARVVLQQLAAHGDNLACGQDHFKALDVVAYDAEFHGARPTCITCH